MRLTESPLGRVAGGIWDWPGLGISRSRRFGYKVSDIDMGDMCEEGANMCCTLVHSMCLGHGRAERVLMPRFLRQVVG